MKWMGALRHVLSHRRDLLADSVCRRILQGPNLPSHAVRIGLLLCRPQHATFMSAGHILVSRTRNTEMCSACASPSLLSVCRLAATHLPHTMWPPHSPSNEEDGGTTVPEICPVGHICPTPSEKASCSVFTDAKCPAGSTAKVDCEGVLAKSVPNEDRSECLCDFGFFDYSQERVSYNGTEPYSGISSSMCIKCPRDGSDCGNPDHPAFKTIGVKYEELSIAEGFWQDPIYLDGLTETQMASREEGVRFEWCGWQTFKERINDTHVVKSEGSLCLGGTKWNRCRVRALLPQPFRLPGPQPVDMRAHQHAACWSELSFSHDTSTCTLHRVTTPVR